MKFFSNHQLNKVYLGKRKIKPTPKISTRKFRRRFNVSQEQISSGRAAVDSEYLGEASPQDFKGINFADPEFKLDFEGDQPPKLSFPRLMDEFSLAMENIMSPFEEVIQEEDVQSVSNPTEGSIILSDSAESIFSSSSEAEASASLEKRRRFRAKPKATNKDFTGLIKN